MTVADLITDVRHNTNDAVSPFRVDDTKMLGFLNAARKRAFSIRPDLKPLPRATEPTDLAANDDLDLSGKATEALTYMVTARCEMADDENVNSNRMAQAVAEFKAMLLSNQ